MRAKICPAILVTVACAQLAMPLMASKPTHTLSRDSRAVPAPTHERSAHQATAHPPARGHATTSHSASSHSKSAAAKPAAIKTHAAAKAVSSRRGHGTTPGASSDSTTADRVHAWEAAQHLAASTSAKETGRVSASQELESAGPPELTSPELPKIRSIEEEAATPVILASLYDHRGKLVVPAPLYGSHEVLLHQNLMADHDGLSRVEDDDDLLILRRERKLVALPEGLTLHVDERLPMDRRYSRPWTAAFLAVLARDFYDTFHEPLQVNSAVRTVQIQRRLLRTNGNAAPIAGDTASPHLTGQAVDIGKRGLTMLQIAWMRTYLQPLMEQGKIDVEEEFQQSCFHISVYKSYELPGHVTLAATPRTDAPAN